MPSSATTNYYLFIFLRFFVFFGYLLTFFCTYNLCIIYNSYKIIKFFEIIFSIVLFIGIYIYLAQILDFWEPLRNRIGTGGQNFIESSVSFSYAFHRLLGTFREPSHFAEWIVGPLLIVLSKLKSSPNKYRLILAALGIVCLILSGSLLGILGFASGLFMMFFFGSFKLSKNFIRPKSCDSYDFNYINS
jgi:hypothetical protein